MLPFYKKYWRTAFDIALIALTVYLIMFAFSYLYKIATPIMFSFVIFACIEPLARRLNKWGIKKTIASGISIMLFGLIILAVFTGAAYLITKQGTALIENFPKYQEMLTKNIGGILAEAEKQLNKIPGDFNIAESSAEWISRAGEWAQKFGAMLLGGMIGYVSSFSSFIFNFVVGIILAYFLSIEIGSWKQIASDKTPRTFKTAFFFLRDNVFKGIGLYVKAQLKMISITFIVILIALLLLGVPNAFVIALVAAIFDILPLLGVSTLFVPWIIYLFIVGQTTLAIWLAALLLVVILARQILEPKITGDSLGVSAFTMLAFMILSLSLFGVAGMILSPVLVILVKSLYDQGYFHSWIRTPIDEFDDPDASASSEAASAAAIAAEQAKDKTPFIERLKNIGKKKEQ